MKSQMVRRHEPCHKSRGGAECRAYFQSKLGTSMRGMETGMENTPMERFTLAADDGFTLSAVRWLPSSGGVGSAPRAALHVVHGMAEYAARYAPFAQAC